MQSHLTAKDAKVAKVQRQAAAPRRAQTPGVRPPRRL